VDLRRLTRQSGETAAPAAPRQRAGWKRGARAAVILLALLIGGALVLWRFRDSAEPARPQFTQLTNFADSVTSPALSPDGRMLAFIRGESTIGGPGQIYVKLLPDGEPLQLTHNGPNVTISRPKFSPDGARIAYAAMENWSLDTWVVARTW